MTKSEIPILAVLSFEKRDNSSGPLVRSAECKTVPGGRVCIPVRTAGGKVSL